MLTASNEHQSLVMLTADCFLMERGLERDVFVLFFVGHYYENKNL